MRFACRKSWMCTTRVGNGNSLSYAAWSVERKCDFTEIGETHADASLFLRVEVTDTDAQHDIVQGLLPCCSLHGDLWPLTSRDVNIFFPQSPPAVPLGCADRSNTDHLISLTKDFLLLLHTSRTLNPPDTHSRSFLLSPLPPAFLPRAQFATHLLFFFFSSTPPLIPFGSLSFLLLSKKTPHAFLSSHNFSATPAQASAT